MLRVPCRSPHLCKTRFCSLKNRRVEPGSCGNSKTRTYLKLWKFWATKQKKRGKMSGIWVCFSFCNSVIAPRVFRMSSLLYKPCVQNNQNIVLWAACSEWAVCWYELCVQSEQNTVLTVSLFQARMAIRSALPECHSPSKLSWLCLQWGKVVNMIKKENNICGFCMQKLPLGSISGPLYCELKVSVRRTQWRGDPRQSKAVYRHSLHEVLSKVPLCLFIAFPKHHALHCL